MVRVSFVVATLVSSMACVNLDMPEVVAECRAGATCRDRSSDASADESRKDEAAVVNRTDPFDVGVPIVDSTDRPRDVGTAAVDSPVDVGTAVVDSTVDVGTAVMDRTDGPHDGSVDSTVGTPGSDCSQQPPTSVRASPSGSAQVTLTWTAVTPTPMSYSILRARGNDGDHQVIAAVAGTVTDYTDADTSLVKDTRYSYRVRADGSCAATSSEVSVTPVCASPDAPAAPTVSNSKGAITVAWTTVPGATAYSVYRDSNPTGYFAEVLSYNQSALTYTDTASGLTNGLTYYYKLSASNAGGQCVSPLSKDGSAMSCAPPDIPSGVKASPRGANQVEVTWDAAAGASQYTILRGTSPGTEIDITPSGAPLTKTSYTDTGLTTDTTYYYRIRAHNGDHNACASPPSSQVMATPSSCVVLPASTNNYGADTTDAYCFVTCWDLPVGVAGVGLNAVNFSGRTLTINGRSIACPSDSDCQLPKDLTKDYSTYSTTGAYVFRVSAGAFTYAKNTWWSPIAGRDCQ